ncbi:MAG: hypothetical protein IJI03_12325 [Rudaea sp.]|nr:hypothetical protein [Rudaea sp.]
MTVFRDYRDALAALVTTDPVFAAAIAALVGQPVTNVIKTNRPMHEIQFGDYPCWVFEAGDGSSASVTNETSEYQSIGLSLQSSVIDMHVALVWTDQDRNRASDARVDLPFHFTQLMLRNPQPGGCEQAVLSGWQPDKGANHPTQVWYALIKSAHVVQRDS